MKTKLNKLFASSVVASAMLMAGGAQASGLSSTGQISEITPGSASVRVFGLSGNPDGCTDSGNGLYVLLYDNPRAKELYAGLLTAKAGGLDVQVFLNGCVDDGPRNLAEIRSIIIK